MHQFGPKKFRLKEHLFALLFMQTAKLSFRRASSLLLELGFFVPTYSALCKSRKRIPAKLWNSLLVETSSYATITVAIDSTGVSMQNPSMHFIKRIDRKNPVKDFVKLSVFYDIDHRKFLAIEISRKRRHDVLDFPELFRRRNKFKNFFGDTAYDSEKIHEACFEKGIQTFIKPRINVRKGFYRKKQMKNYSGEIYHQRSLIETGFSVIKRKYGSYTLAKNMRSVSAEMYLRAIASNLSLWY